MTFASDEISVASGQPVELYRFVLRGTSTEWFYTSAAYNISYGGDTYLATPGLSRQAIDEIDDPLKHELRINMPTTHVFPQRWILNQPDGIIDITVFRGHGANFIQYWDGVIKTVNTLTSKDNSLIVCGPPTEAMQASFVSRTFRRGCDVALYSDECTIEKGLYSVSGFLTAVSGSSLTSSIFATKADDWFTGGYVITLGYKKRIKDHATDTVTVVSPIPGVAVGTSIVAYAGCDHTRSTCKTKFDNVLNYRGCDWIPDMEPFTQDVLK